MKYAWQRAWRGYDDTDIFNMDCNLREKLIVMLERFNKIRCGLFTKPHGELVDIHDLEKHVMTDDETSEAIKKMIELLRKSDEWFYHDENYDLKDGYTYDMVFEECEKNKNEFLEMMKIYGNQLWD